MQHRCDDMRVQQFSQLARYGSKAIDQYTGSISVFFFASYLTRDRQEYVE
jgi:hypothetical protein